MKPVGRTSQFTAIIAFLGILISLPLPWKIISIGFDDYGVRLSGVVLNGIQIDTGIICAIIGIITLILIFKRSRWALLPCVAICGLVLIEFNKEGVSHSSTELGIGMYLLGLCSLALTLSVIISWRDWSTNS